MVKPPVADPVFSQKKRFRPLNILMALLIPAIAIMTVLALNRYRVIEQRLNYSVSENVIWAAAQAEVELNLFLSSLTDAAQAPTPQSRARVLERFDILWSRISLYRAGTLRRSLESNAELRARVDDLMSDLKEVDGILAGSPTVADFGQIRTLMRRHLGPMQQLTVFALTTDRTERQGIQKTQEEVRQELAVLMSLFLVTVAGAIVHLFFSERRAQRHLASVIRSRKKAAETWNRLQEAVEAINEGFVLYDAEDRLVLCNTKYREIYALSAAAMVPGVRFEDLLKFGIAHGQYQDAKADPEGWLKARLDRRKADAEPFEQELGDGRWLMVSDRRTSDGGRVGIRTDITDLKRNVAELTNAQQDLAAQAERMRKLAEAADEASRAKTGFMAMISHEIRTPLNAVLGLGNLLAETRLDDRQRTFVAGIDDAGTHLLALINNILDYSRFESGKDNGTPVPTKLRELVDGVARMIGVLASEKRIAFSVDIQDGLPEWLMLDPAFLKQVLINLLGNAVNFTQAGGVQLAVSAMDAGEDRIQLRMTITDSGIGIAEAMQERIFEPFERSTLPDGRTSGAGLGLAISRRLVTAMGGQIRLAKSDTSGTTFVVELPAQLCGEPPEKASTVNAGAADASQQTIAAVRSLAILVAEDTPASQLVIQAMLEHRGHRVTLVSDGGAALEAAGRQDFDLIILDIQMPRMYGYDVVAGIRKLPGARGKVPVAALTAQAFDEDRKRALAAGFDFHLSKPIRPAELASLLERAAARTAANDRCSRPEMPLMSGEPDHLQELEQACAPETFRMLLRTAIANIELEQRELRLAEEKNDHGAVRQSAHRLSALLGQYGNPLAMTAAASVENASSDTLAEQLALLHVEITRTLQYLRDRQAD